MYNEPIIKKKKKIPKGLFIMLTVFGLVLTLGLTYAYFIYEEQGNSHELIAGSLYMNSTNSGNVSLTGLYPMTNKDGIENGIKYNFTVEGHNLTDKDIYYGVYVNKGSEVANKTRFKDSDIKLYLTETINNVTKVVYGPDTLEEFNRSLIYAKTIDANLKKENAIDISYELTMWLDEKVLISDTITELEGRSIYTSEQFKNSYASIKLEVYGDFEEKKGPYNYMMSSPWYSSDIDAQKANITEVHFVSMKQDEIDTRYEASTIKKDVTDTSITNPGSVKSWLETDTTDTTKYIMYVASDGTTFFPRYSHQIFSNYSSLTNITFDNVNTRDVTDMMIMFGGCSALTSLDLSGFDTSSVSNMYSMFNGCSGLTSLDVSGFDTSSVSNMSYMFNNCSNLTSLDIGNWDTSSVTNMNSMFARCGGLTSLDIGNWDTSSVTDMIRMFNNCSNLTSLDIGDWDTSSVSNMSYMFNMCSGLTSLDVNDWDISSVTNMVQMFYNCSNLTSLEISDWDTSSVTDMSLMFSSCSSLTSLELNKWNIAGVSNLVSMFSNCNNLTSLDVSNWDTSSVTDMSHMFANCYNLTNLEIGNWDTSGVTNMSSMFDSCFYLTGLNLNNWDTSSVTDMKRMFYYCNNLTSLQIGNWDTSGVTNMSSMFYYCKNLTSLDISNFTFDSVTSYSSIFNGMKARTDNTPTITAKDATTQNWILALTSSDRPSSWTVDNVVLKSSVQ